MKKQANIQNSETGLDTRHSPKNCVDTKTDKNAILKEKDLQKLSRNTKTHDK